MLLRVEEGSKPAIKNKSAKRTVDVALNFVLLADPRGACFPVLGFPSAPGCEQQTNLGCAHLKPAAPVSP